MYELDKTIAVNGSEIKFQLKPEKPNYFTIVATDNDYVIGMASCITEMCDIKTLAQLSMIFVRDNYQKHGIGTRLLSLVEQEAAERGMGCISLNPSPADPDLHEWYQKRGYTRAPHLGPRTMSKYIKAETIKSLEQLYSQKI